MKRNKLRKIFRSIVCICVSYPFVLRFFYSIFVGRTQTVLIATNSNVVNSIFNAVIYELLASLCYFMRTRRCTIYM